MTALFKKAKYKKYSRIVKMDSPMNARKSSRQLNKEFKLAKTKTKRIRILRVAILTTNRAKAIQHRKNISPKERKEVKEINRIYSKLVYELKQKV
jgi:hypothetical protein